MKLRFLAGAMIAGMMALIWWPKLGLPGIGGPNHWKDGLHAPFFAILTLLVFVLTPAPWPIKKRIFFTLMLSLSLAAITEAVQPFFRRTASFGDLLANLIGIAATVSGLWIHRVRKSGIAIKCLHGIVSIACMLALFLPAFRHWHGQSWLKDQLPNLSNFDDSRAFDFWVSQGFAAVQSAPDSANGVRILTRRGFWSGISFYPGKQDWSEYTTLTLEFENPDTSPFELGLRIDDDGDSSQPESRFSDSLDLPAGASTHRIPLEKIASVSKDRRMNLTGITRLALFLRPDDPARVFFLKRAFLE